MKQEERIKMFKDVFAPKSEEKVLFLIDIPHDNIKDNTTWKDRREMARSWYQTFTEMSSETGFSVSMMEYKATGAHNSPVPQEVLTRDLLTMVLLTTSLFVICYGFKGRPGRVNRIEGILLLTTFIGYTTYLVANVVRS